MKKTLLFLMAFAMIAFYACKDDEGDPAPGTTNNTDTTKVDFCDSVAATYVKDIKAVVDVNCATAGCHEDASTAPKGIRLATYDQVKAATAFPAFLKSIKHEDGATNMPIGKDKLDDNTIKVIECWIDGGTKEQ